MSAEIDKCEVCHLPTKCQELREKLEAHCLSTSWQRDDILFRVARERGWDEGKMVETLDRILTEHKEAVEEAGRIFGEYQKLRAAIQPMMEDAARCNEEVAYKNITIKELNKEWKSRCDSLETANAKLLSGLADNMENINRYQIAEDLLREVLPVLDRNQMDWTLKRKVNAVLQPNIKV